MKNNRSTVLIMTILVTILVPTVAFSQSVLVDGDGVAVEGYDVVAYFTMNEAVPGSSRFSVEHEGALYYFSSAEHRGLFVADPDAYIPQYGGYCAWAVSNGYTASIQPDQFVVHDDRLFLNFNARLNRRFQGDLDNRINDADRNWPDIEADLGN